MRIVPRGWKSETWVCSMRGHVTPASEVRTLRPSDESLAIIVADGTRLCRCLRCDAWIHTGEPDDDSSREFLPPMQEMPRPRRGRQLDDLIVLRLIALERVVHSVVFGLLALGLVLARHDHRWLVHQAADLRDNSSRDASLRWVTDQLDRFIDLRGSTITLLMITAALYAISEGVEAFGLWREKRWAEYLTALATAGFLPFEIDFLMKDVTILRLIALGINLSVLAYLIVVRRLFGLRGGAKALAQSQQHRVDWDEILAEPPTERP